MRRIVAVAALVLGAFSLVGCVRGPVGTWNLKEMSPPEASQHFAIQRVTFHGDGTYTARAERDGEAVELGGKYEFDREQHKLVFHDERGRTRSYFVEICGACGRLEVSNEGKPTKWTALLVRK